MAQERAIDRSIALMLGLAAFADSGGDEDSVPTGRPFECTYLGPFRENSLIKQPAHTPLF